MLTVISYDIESDLARNRIHRVLKGFGERVQYSVFECWLKPEDFERLREKLAPQVNGQFDSIRFYRVCGSCVTSIEVMGWGGPPEKPDVWVV